MQTVFFPTSIQCNEIKEDFLKKNTYIIILLSDNSICGFEDKVKIVNRRQTAHALRYMSLYGHIWHSK